LDLLSGREPTCLWTVWKVLLELAYGILFYAKCQINPLIGTRLNSGEPPDPRNGSICRRDGRVVLFYGSEEIEQY
jgi:hypothetical protein